MLILFSSPRSFAIISAVKNLVSDLVSNAMDKAKDLARANDLMKNQSWSKTIEQISHRVMAK